jgi:hypothetical protein
VGLRPGESGRSADASAVHCIRFDSILIGLIPRSLLRKDQTSASHTPQLAAGQLILLRLIVIDSSILSSRAVAALRRIERCARKTISILWA